LWAAPELLGAPTIGEESARAGGGGRSRPKYSKTAKKTGGFAHVLAYKSPKTPFFAQKYLRRYTHETFLTNKTIFKITS
jgi:hypothetical protein